MIQQVLTGLAVFLGEALIIGAEMWAAKNFSNSPNPWGLVATTFLVSIVGVILLVYGYTWGYQVFKNIWIIMALSVAGILIVEPPVAWLLFQELPTKGAFIGFILGMIGVIITTIVK